MLPPLPSPLARPAGALAHVSVRYSAECPHFEPRKATTRPGRVRSHTSRDFKGKAKPECVSTSHLQKCWPTQLVEAEAGCGEIKRVQRRSQCHVASSGNACTFMSLILFALGFICLLLSPVSNALSARNCSAPRASAVCIARRAPGHGTADTRQRGSRLGGQLGKKRLAHVEANRFRKSKASAWPHLFFRELASSPMRFASLQGLPARLGQTPQLAMAKGACGKRALAAA